MQAVRETAVLRDMVQVVNVDVRRLAHRNATAWAEAPDSRGVCVLVVVVHRMRLAHVRGRVVRHCGHGNPAIPVSVTDCDYRVRDRPRVPGVPVHGGVKVQRHRGEYGTGTSVVNVNGCVDCEGA